MPNLNLLNNLKSFQIAKPNSQLGKLSETDIKTIDFDKSFEGESSDVSYGISGKSAVSITALNKHNTGMADETDEDNVDRIGKEVTFPDYPWSYGDGQTDVALVYGIDAGISGRVGLSTPIGGGASASIGIEAGASPSLQFVRLHKPKDKVGAAVESDLANFVLPFDPEAIMGLEAPNREFTVAEFESNFAITAKISWGKMFATSSGLLRAISPNSDALKISGGAEAFASANVGVASRLQLIASKPNDGTARIEFRKAKRGVRGIGAGLKVSATIDNPEVLGTALDQLLANTLNFEPEQLTELRTKLNSIKQQFGIDQFESTELQHLAQSVLDRVGLSPEKLQAKIVDVLSQTKALAALKELRDIGSGETDLTTALSKISDRADLSKLTEEVQSTAERILQRMALENADLPLIGGLLQDDSFKTKITTELSGVTDSALQTLSSEISNLIDEKTLSLADIEVPGAKTIVQLLNEEEALTIPQIFENFRTQQLRERLAGGPSNLKLLNNAYKKAAGALDILSQENAGLVSVAEQLAQHFGIAEVQISAKLNDLVRQIKEVAQNTVVLEATLQFNRVRTREALFKFDFNYSANPTLFQSIYKDLLKGKFQPAVDAYNSNQNLFNNVDFFKSLTDEKTRAFKVSLLLKKSKVRTQVSSEMENLAGDQKLAFSESLELTGALGALGDREWSTALTLSGAMKDFAKTPSANDFEFHLDTELEWSGKMDPESDFTPFENNYNSMLFMGRTLVASEKSQVTQKTLSSAFATALATDKSPLFKLALQLDNQALEWLWQPANQTDLAKLYEAAFEQTLQEPKVFANKTRKLLSKKPDRTGDAVAALKALKAVGTLVRNAGGADALQGSMASWTKAYRQANIDPTKRDFVFKFCFLD
ncbi:MAG: hypothetical protein AAF585_16895, partial [Verrucomicrobiota bacterium]